MDILNTKKLCLCGCGAPVRLETHRYLHAHNPSVFKGQTKENNSIIKNRAEKQTSRDYNRKLIQGYRLYEDEKEYFCLCGCGDKIVLKHYHKKVGVPQLIKNHIHRGKPKWNSGLTAETDERVARMSTIFKGRKVWNEGLTKETDSRIFTATEKNKIAWTPERRITFSKATEQLLRGKGKIPKFLSEYEKALIEPLYCLCGCGEQITIKPHYKYYGISLYISGHNLAPMAISTPDIHTKRSYKFKNGYFFSTKAEKRIYYTKNKAKFEAARDYCKTNNMTFSVWTEKKLYPKETQC